MDTPRSKSRRDRRKASRQASPERLTLASKIEAHRQPEAGPSRLPDQSTAAQPITNLKALNQFSSDLDFIALEPGEEETHPKRPAREWDRGKNERDWNRDRDRDRDVRTTGRKRRREDSERDEPHSTRATEAKKLALRSMRSPWTTDVNWDSCRNVAQLLHREVEAYLRYISPTTIEREVRHMTILLIAGSVKKAYPDAEVLPFGSFETKLYLPQGDVDLVVKSQALASLDRVSSLRSLANIVRRTGITDQVTVISKAKVPIIKFVTKYGRLAVDISINQSNGVQAGEMINHFLREFPALQALVLIVKSFLKQRNLNEVYSGGLGSYAIVCLAVSFLQMHPKVRRAEIDSAKNLGVLMLEFFELYGKYFNYSNAGISLRHGGSYFSKQARGWRDYNRPYLLSIEDPGDISNDISKGSFGIKKVKQTFAGAYELMVSSLYAVAEILSARQEARAVDLRRGSNLERRPEEMSVLSSILGIDQETINHRRLVQQVYEEGGLARLLGIEPLVELNMSSQMIVEKRSREVESVAEAWGEADMVIGSEEEEDREMPSNEQNGHKRGSVAEEEGVTEESRYDITARQNGRAPSQGGPASKRRRTMPAKDLNSVSAGTVFVPDDDEDDEDNIDTDNHSEQVTFYVDVDGTTTNSSDGLGAIERAYRKAGGEFLDTEEGLEDKEVDEDSAYLSKGKGRGKLLSSEVRQAYWAAKGALGFDSDSP